MAFTHCFRGSGDVHGGWKGCGESHVPALYAPVSLESQLFSCLNSNPLGCDYRGDMPKWYPSFLLSRGAP